MEFREDPQHGSIRCRGRSIAHASIVSSTQMENIMLIGGGLLGTVLLIVLVVWLVRRV